MGCSITNIVYTTSAHDVMATERNYFQLRNVTYYTGTSSLDPQNSKRFPPKAGFHYAQVFFFKDGFHCIYSPIYMPLTGTYKMCFRYSF